MRRTTTLNKLNLLKGFPSLIENQKHHDVSSRFLKRRYLRQDNLNLPIQLALNLFPKYHFPKMSFANIPEIAKPISFDFDKDVFSQYDLKSDITQSNFNNQSPQRQILLKITNYLEITTRNHFLIKKSQNFIKFGAKTENLNKFRIK